MARGKGEGSIYQRPDGRWVAQVDLGIKGGKRRRKYIYGKTRKAVADRLVVALRDQQQGLLIGTEGQSVGQFLEHWLESSAKPAVRPSTYRSYAMHVRLHLKPAFGSIKLTKLAPQHIQAFMNDRLNEGLSPNTVLRIRSTLRRALNQGMKWGLIARNPATLVDPPKAERHEVEPMTPEEARRFLEGIKGHRFEALYLIALGVGLRQGEILAIRWADLDLGAGTLSVRNSIQRVNGKLKLVPPKGHHAVRALALPPTVVDRLRERRTIQRRERLLAGGMWVDEGFVFTNRWGGPLDGTNIYHQFQNLLAACGLPRRRFHDLRHSCASFLLAQGIPPRVVMAQLGHSQISLTMDTYSHVLPAVQREAAEQIDQFLAGG